MSNKELFLVQIQKNADQKYLFEHFSSSGSLEKLTFGPKMATSGKFQSTYNSKPLKKLSSFIDLAVSV